MKEVAAKTEAGDEKERFDSQVRFEHDQRDQPGKYSDDRERQDPVVTRKQPGLDREHVNHEDDRIANDEENVGKLGQNPFAKYAFENQQEKIDPDRPFETSQRP